MTLKSWTSTHHQLRTQLNSSQKEEENPGEATFSFCTTISWWESVTQYYAWVMYLLQIFNTCFSELVPLLMLFCGLAVLNWMCLFISWMEWNLGFLSERKNVYRLREGYNPVVFRPIACLSLSNPGSLVNKTATRPWHGAITAAVGSKALNFVVLLSRLHISSWS